MSTNSYRLYGAPNIFPGESMSSWLQRLSQQQGISIEKLFSLAGAKAPKDIDSAALSAGILKLINMCGFSSRNFAIVIAASRAIQKTKPLQQQVHADLKGKPVSAFCPGCLDSDRSPYYRLEWRFKFWKYCPEHKSPMLIVCGKCNQEIALDKSILLSLTPPPNLGYCQFCMSKFSHANELVIDVALNIDEKVSVQRNMMAGVLNGYCMIAPHEKKFTLHVMVRLHQLGLLLPAMRTDFDKLVDPEQVIVLAKFLKNLQVQIRRKELMHERASRRWRMRSPSSLTSADSR